MTIEYENPWFSVVKQGKYHFIKENNSNNGAVILLEADDAFVFVKVFRKAHNAFLIEAPRGYGEKDELAQKSAARELFEETGYEVESSQLKHIGTIQPNSAILSSALPIFYAKVDKRRDVSAIDSEISEIVYIPTDQLVSAIVRGEITDGITLSAIALYWACSKD